MAKVVRMLCAAKFRSGGPLSVEMLVSPDDPFRIVQTIFRYPDGGAEWVFAFELIEILFKQHEAGEGDFQLALAVDEVIIRLTGDEGAAEVLIPLNPLQKFHGAVKKLPSPRRSAEDAVDAAIKALRR